MSAGQSGVELYDVKIVLVCERLSSRDMLMVIVSCAASVMTASFDESCWMAATSALISANTDLANWMLSVPWRWSPP